MDSSPILLVRAISVFISNSITTATYPEDRGGGGGIGIEREEDSGDNENMTGKVKTQP